MVLAGTRSVEQPQAQHHAAPPGGGERPDLLLGGKGGAQDDRDFSDRRVLGDRPIAWVDEGDGRLNVRLDVGGQSGVDQDGRCLGAQPVVILPSLGLLYPVQRLDAGRQVKHGVNAAHGRAHGAGSNNQARPARGHHLMPVRLHEWPERSSLHPVPPVTSMRITSTPSRSAGRCGRDRRTTGCSPDFGEAHSVAAGA
ncbi:MAG TPA: hypothetical protein VMA73_07110 [Streptosporangiaceae bacterium]|nr:hypothetical protein [Streptosporangiaceae bacterium]